MRTEQEIVEAINGLASELAKCPEGSLKNLLSQCLRALLWVMGDDKRPIIVPQSQIEFLKLFF